jgi:AP-1 complex subunit mu
MIKSCSRAQVEVRLPISLLQHSFLISIPPTAVAARGKAIEMEDVKFHQCVRLSRFENDRTISFIPPDGEFELMSYRLSTPVKPLVWVEAAVESHKGSRVEYVVKVKAQFKRRSTANNVEIYVPVPDDADSPKFRVSLRIVSENNK